MGRMLKVELSEQIMSNQSEFSLHICLSHVGSKPWSWEGLIFQTSLAEHKTSEQVSTEDLQYDRFPWPLALEMRLPRWFQRNQARFFPDLYLQEESPFLAHGLPVRAGYLNNIWALPAGIKRRMAVDIYCTSFRKSLYEKLGRLSSIPSSPKAPHINSPANLHCQIFYESTFPLYKWQPLFRTYLGPPL